MTRENTEVTKKPLKRIADFEWASVGRYLEYISSAVGLKEVSSHAITSFPLARLGPEKVINQKGKTEKALKWNISALERFVGSRKSDLGSGELVVLRGLYIQYKCNLKTVKEHIGSADFYRRSIDVSMFETPEGEEDEFPF